MAQKKIERKKASAPKKGSAVPLKAKSKVSSKIKAKPAAKSSKRKSPLKKANPKKETWADRESNELHEADAMDTLDAGGKMQDQTMEKPKKSPRAHQPTDVHAHQVVKEHQNVKAYLRPRNQILRRP